MTLVMDGVSVEYGRSGASPVRAVDDVSLTVEAGDKLGLVGESGCGKSTLAYAILRVLPPNASIVRGDISFNGRNLTASDRAELEDVQWKKISMVFQSSMNAFSPVHRVGDQLAAVHRARAGSDRRTARRAARDALVRVGIPETRVFGYPHEFSGGMRQRAAIALALLLDPELLIADEPTTALDVVVQSRILEILEEWQEGGDRALIFVSHDIGVVAKVCKRIAVMYAGEIAEIGSKVTVLAEPRHPYTQALLKCVPRVRGSSTELSTLPGSPPDLSSRHEGCLFRPRCSKAFEDCKTIRPDLFLVHEEQRARCLLNRP